MLLARPSCESMVRFGYGAIRRSRFVNSKFGDFGIWPRKIYFFQVRLYSGPVRVVAWRQVLGSLEVSEWPRGDCGRNKASAVGQYAVTNVGMETVGQGGAGSGEARTTRVFGGLKFLLRPSRSANASIFIGEWLRCPKFPPAIFGHLTRTAGFCGVAPRERRAA